MDEKLNIPKRINVGFQHRSGTYTGFLAYIIYWDDKGKLRKETSWENWRHKPGSKYWDGSYKVAGDEVNPKAFDNIPTEGFVLNKGVGGQRHSYGWNARNEYIRVYDPRGFEFEISVANLLFILQESTSTKGKGLEGKFVYAWAGKELVLLPVDSYEYQKSTENISFQAKKITKTDILEGCTYKDSQGRNLVYIGRFIYTEYHYRGYISDSNKKHIFYDLKSNSYYAFNGFTQLKERLTDTPIDNYAELVDSYFKTKNGATITEIVSEKFTPIVINNGYTWSRRYGVKEAKHCFIKNEDNSYSQVFFSEAIEKSDVKYWLKEKIELKNSILVETPIKDSTRYEFQRLNIDFFHIKAKLSNGETVNI